MKRMKYSVIETIIYLEESGEYRTFGLHVKELFENNQSETHTLNYVSTDKTVVTEMARLFNKEQLETIHLADVLEDML